MPESGRLSPAPSLCQLYDPPAPPVVHLAGVCGKYAARFAAGTNIVVLAPDVADIFPTSQAVNDASRALSELARRQTHRAAG